MAEPNVPAELIELAMTGANPGCRDDAQFYLANVITEIRADERAKVAEEIGGLWPDTFGAWNADQAHAARTVKEQILRRITRDTAPASEHASSQASEHGASELRDRIAGALKVWHAINAVVCEHSQIISYSEAADAVLAVRDEELENWKQRALTAEQGNVIQIREARQCAEQAQAERDEAREHHERTRQSLDRQLAIVQRIQAERNKAKAEVARLRAGQADHPGDPATVPTPAEWIRRYNDLPADRRLEVAKIDIDARDRASRCFLMDHDGRLEQADHHRRQLTQIHAIRDNWTGAALDPQASALLAELTEALSSVTATTPPDEAVTAARPPAEVTEGDRTYPDRPIRQSTNQSRE